MLATAELIALAIEAGARLARTGHKIYGDEGVDRKFVLNLPAGLGSLPASAKAYAEKLAGQAETLARYEQLFKTRHEAFMNGTASEKKAAELQLVQLYLRDLAHGLVPGRNAAEQEWAGLAALKQWEKGSSNLPHPLQRLSASLVETGIDWLLQLQRAEAGRGGKVIYIRSLLLGLQRFDLEDSRWDLMVLGLFSAGLQAFQNYRTLPAGGSAIRDLTEAVAAGLAGKLKEQAKKEEASQSDETSSEIETLRLDAPSMLRCLLSNTALVAEQSASLAALSPEIRSALMEQLSACFAGFLLEREDEALRQLFPIVISSAHLDRLTAGVIRAVAEFPLFFANGEGPGIWLRELLADLARPRKEGSLYEPSLVAEAAVLLVEMGLPDLPVLARNPSTRQLFVVAALRGLLEVLTQPLSQEEKGTLRDRLSRAELRGLFAAFLSAWVGRPEWLFRRATQQERAATLLPVVIEALAELDAGSLKALLRNEKLTAVLVAVSISGLSGKLSALNGRRIADVLNIVLSEMTANGIAGWALLLESDRLADLLTAIAGSKAEDRLFGEEEETARQAARVIASVTFDLRSGKILSVPEMVERLNKGK